MADLEKIIMSFDEAKSIEILFEQKDQEILSLKKQVEKLKETRRELADQLDNEKTTSTIVQETLQKEREAKRATASEIDHLKNEKEELQKLVGKLKFELSESAGYIQKDMTRAGHQKQTEAVHDAQLEKLKEEFSAREVMLESKITRLLGESKLMQGELNDLHNEREALQLSCNNLQLEVEFERQAKSIRSRNLQDERIEMMKAELEQKTTEIEALRETAIELLGRISICIISILIISIVMYSFS